MPTHNDRTVPSPERDEELETAITQAINEAYFCPTPSIEWHKVAMRKVDAFSTRRAREKAIEECLAEVPEQKDKGDDEFATGYYQAFNDIHAYIARLKTK